MSLQIKNISKSFGKNRVLTNISFALEQGSITGLLGANGAGKSTLFNILSGVSDAESGGIEYRGQSVKSLSKKERAQIFSVVPQLSNLGGAFSVEQVVRLGRTPYMDWQGNPSEIDLESISQSIKQTNLQGMENRKISTLSGGERQRVLFARALAQETPIMLLDEPTNNLDIKYQIEFFQLIKKISKDKVKTVLIALHDLNYAGYVFEHALMLKNGLLFKSGLTKDVLTEENIKSIYDIDVKVEKDTSGTIRIVPQL
jgi:iron complex transport system ATP-binding protein